MTRAISQSTPITLGVLTLFVGGLCTTAFFTGVLWTKVAYAERVNTHQDELLKVQGQQLVELKELAKDSKRRLELMEGMP